MSLGPVVNAGTLRFLPAAALCFLIILSQGSGVAAAAVPEPEGFRLNQYRSDVPATLRGARAVSSDEAKALHDAHQTLFIDVLPRPPKPSNLPKGTIWRDMRRDSISGSFWLPNVGYGRLHATVAAYFKAQLVRLTGGDRSKAVLFFCLERCWMSWNAAKRALEYGYTNVIWYSEGSDGWTAAGHALERIEPEK